MRSVETETDKRNRQLRHLQVQAECYSRREDFQVVVELLQIRLEEAKAGMVVCPPSELPRLQGAAVALDAMLVAILIPKMKIERPVKPVEQVPGGIELW